MSLSSNPYEVGSDLIPDADEPHRRPAVWRAVIALQILAYAAYIAASVFAAGFTAIMGFGTSRTDERLLFFLMLLAAPIIAWLFIGELRTWRVADPNHERSLAGFSVLFSMAPFIMSAFHIYEYIEFGAFELNAVPGIILLSVGALWASAATIRYRRAQRAGSKHGLA